MCWGEVINYDKGNKKCILIFYVFFELLYIGSFDMVLNGVWNIF